MTRTPAPAIRSCTDLRVVVPMPPLDAWLYRQQHDSPTPALVTCVAWFTGPAPAISDLRTLAAERLAAFQRLHAIPWIPTPRGRDGSWPHWATGPDFSPDHHITSAPCPPAAAFEDHLARLITQPLAPDLPLWHLHLVPTSEGFALVLRSHRALLDFRSMMTILDSLLDQGLTGGGHPVATVPAPSRVRRLAWAMDDLLPKARHLPIHDQPGRERHVAFATVSAADFEAARSAAFGKAAAMPVSGTAVFLSATGGALRALGLTGKATRLPGLCALVPVDVRPPHQARRLGNHYATARVALSTHPDPRVRLSAIARQIRPDPLLRRARAQAAMVSGHPRRVTAVGKILSRYLDSPQYFSLLCSSATRPSGPPPTLGPAQLTAMAEVPPLGPDHPFAVTLCHHQGDAVITVATDEHHARMAGPLAMTIRDEIRLIELPR